MKRTGNSSSSPRADTSGRLIIVPFELLRAHPANSNVMSDEFFAKLVANIDREGDYEPLVARPHPTDVDCYQVLNGHHRWRGLESLGYKEARIYLWPCDDETALRLLATLNRLEGQDDPLRRAELLRELSSLASPEELARLLPEDAGAITRSLELLDLNLDDLLADLGRQAAPGDGLRAITFAVTADDEQAIEEAVRQLADTLDGSNRRGRALGLIARAYLGGATS